MTFALDRDLRNNVWGVLKDGQKWLVFAKDDEAVLAELVARLNAGVAADRELTHLRDMAARYQKIVILLEEAYSNPFGSEQNEKSSGSAGS